MHRIWYYLVKRQKNSSFYTYYILLYWFSCEELGVCLILFLGRLEFDSGCVELMMTCLIVVD